MLDHEALKQAQELAVVCKLGYGDSVRHTSYTYKRIPFNHQLIINGAFGRGYCRLFWHEESVVISFRGRKPLFDWEIANFKPRPAPLHGCGDAAGVYVHGGFQQQLDFGEVHGETRALDEIISRLQQFDLLDMNMSITGHSMGGALAILFAAKFRCLYPEVVKQYLQKVVTFGAPAVGKAEFGKYYGDLNEITWRIVNRRDPMPDTPVAMYHHVGQELCLQGERRKRPFHGFAGLLLGGKKDHEIKSYVENLTMMLDKF